MYVCMYICISKKLTLTITSYTFYCNFMSSDISDGKKPGKPPEIAQQGISNDDPLTTKKPEDEKN